MGEFMYAFMLYLKEIAKGQRPLSNSIGQRPMYWKRQFLALKGRKPI